MVAVRAPRTSQQHLTVAVYHWVAMVCARAQMVAALSGTERPTPQNIAHTSAHMHTHLLTIFLACLPFCLLPTVLQAQVPLLSGCREASNHKHHTYINTLAHAASADPYSCLPCCLRALLLSCKPLPESPPWYALLLKHLLTRVRAFAAAKLLAALLSCKHRCRCLSPHPGMRSSARPFTRSTK
jgi:hypothetical protein